MDHANLAQARLEIVHDMLQNPCAEEKLQNNLTLMRESFEMLEADIQKCGVERDTCVAKIIQQSEDSNGKTINEHLYESQQLIEKDLSKIREIQDAVLAEIMLYEDFFANRHGVDDEALARELQAADYQTSDGSAFCTVRSPKSSTKSEKPGDSVYEVPEDCHSLRALKQLRKWDIDLNPEALLRLRQSVAGQSMESQTKSLRQQMVDPSTDAHWLEIAYLAYQRTWGPLNFCIWLKNNIHKVLDVDDRVNLWALFWAAIPTLDAGEQFFDSSEDMTFIKYRRLWQKENIEAKSSTVQPNVKPIQLRTRLHYWGYPQPNTKNVSEILESLSHLDPQEKLKTLSKSFPTKSTEQLDMACAIYQCFCEMKSTEADKEFIVFMQSMIPNLAKRQDPLAGLLWATVASENTANFFYNPNSQHSYLEWIALNSALLEP